LNPFLSLAANESLTPVNEVFEPTKVSVIIPTYNRFSFLLNSLSSVKSQTYKNLEVIIINDASTEEEYYNYDFKENFGDNFHILHLPKNSRSIHGKVAGGGHARNIAMMLSDAKYVAFLDDDDQFLPNKLEVQVKYLENSDCKISCTEALCGSGPMDTNKAYDNWHYNGAFWNSLKSIFSAVGKSENLDQMFNGDTNIWTEEDILTHNCCICSTVMIDRSVLDQAGYFPLKPSAEDWAYWKKILKHTNCLYIREPLSYMDSSHGDGQLWL
jgi:glycosyltransferase involved in cell wall biosynthesis